MKSIFLGLMLACVTTIAAGASKNSSLEIVLVHPESTQEAESGVVVFRMTNRGDAPIYVFKLSTPFNSNLDGKLLNNVFTVVDANGKEARYTGMYVSAGVDASSYVKMSPGETVSKKIDLSKSYNLHAGGPYKVSFNGTVLGDPSADLSDTMRVPRPEFMKRITSNDLDIWINSVLIEAKIPSERTLEQPSLGILDWAPQFEMCDGKQNDINAALDRARSLVNASRRHGSDLEYIDQNNYLKLHDDFRQNNWFGAYDDNWLPALDPVAARDIENFYPAKIVIAISNRLSDSLSFDCSCPDSWFPDGIRPPGAAAVALANQKIGICDHFFELDDKGFDTKAGALVHEASHFSDDLAEGTRDISNGYGTGRAAELARTSKSDAKKNGDNYKYYIESGDL